MWLAKFGKDGGKKIEKNEDEDIVGEERIG